MSTMNMNKSFTRTVLSAAALVLMAGSITLAQPSGNPPAGLGGPKVKDTNPPGARGGFGEGNTQINKKDRPIEIPFMMFMKTVNETLTGGSTALTADQKSKIEAISTSFRDSEKAFRQEHGKELRELMGQLGMQGPGGRGGPGGPGGEGGPGGGPNGKGGKGGKGGPGGPPPGGPEAMGEPGQDAPAGGRPDGAGGRPRGPRPEGGPGGPGGEGRPGGRGGPGGPGGPGAASNARPELSPEQREALMTKMRELRDKGPNQEDTKKSVWAVLTAEQQALVQPKLDGFIKERTEERTKRMAEGQAARKVKDLEQQDQKNQPAGDKKPGKKRQPSPDQPSPDAPK